MADKKKTETKSETKSTDAKSDGGTSTDTKSVDTKSADTKSKGYSRGENQKPVTETYRSNWDSIFGKKKRSTGK